MSRIFPTNQAETLAQLRNNRIVPNRRHLQANNSTYETIIQSIEYNQVSIPKDTNNRTDAPSYIRHFNTTNELLDFLEEQRLDNYRIMTLLDLTMYKDEKAIPIYIIQ